MRIVAGRFRGKTLLSPSDVSIRPTADRVREAVFNIIASRLGPVLDGRRVLDLFAGTGALGLEALSRGAARALFLERDKRQAAAIAADLARLGQDAGEVRCVDALATLALASPETFDIVFVDPPFGSDSWTPAAALLDGGSWLSPQAWVYVEAGRDNAWSVPERWQLHRQRDAGEVRGSLFRVAASRT